MHAPKQMSVRRSPRWQFTIFFPTCRGPLHFVSLATFSRSLSRKTHDPVTICFDSVLFSLSLAVLLPPPYHPVLRAISLTTPTFCCYDTV